MGRPRRHALPEDVLISNSAATKAGSVLRKSVSRGEVSREEWRSAYRVVVQYRAMHSSPMTRVTNSVRHYVKKTTDDDSLRPSQRHKRMNRIIDKLRRFPRMRLAQMEDIGGCRVVLPTLEQVYAVTERIRRRWPEAEIVDYIEDPKASGYRAIHIIERRDGRLVEIQLRTKNQDQWAVAVESWAPPAVAFNLKDDPASAPGEVCSYFDVVGKIFALADRGKGADDTLIAELNRLAEEIQPYVKTAREQG